MDYEKEYKSLVAKIKNAHLYAQTDSTKNVLEDILPTLTESNDDRIRKCIRMALTDVDEQRFKDFGTSLADCLAYIEKQKEQPPTVNDIAAAYQFGLAEGRKEQKPVEGCEDEKIKKALLRCCDDWEKGQFGCMAKEDVPAIRAYLEKHKEKQPARWLDGDMSAAREDLIACCRDWERGERTTLLPIVATRARYFLEHLQQPAEWSEEDEKHVASLLKRLDGMCKKGATFTQTRFAVSEDMDWLKSRRGYYEKMKEL